MSINQGEQNKKKKSEGRTECGVALVAASGLGSPVGSSDPWGRVFCQTLNNGRVE